MRKIVALIAFGLWAGASASLAGPIFLTGHDPDFHAQDSVAAQNLLKEALNYATGGTYASGTQKFLFVESEILTPGGLREALQTL